MNKLQDCKYQLPLDWVYLGEGDNMFRHVSQYGFSCIFNFKWSRKSESGRLNQGIWNLLQGGKREIIDLFLVWL